MPTLERSARQQLEQAAARLRLDDRAIYRAIHRAVQDGLSQRQISDIVGNLSQATVQRIIQRLAANPALLAETPAEIIDRRAAGIIDSQVMMKQLTKWRYIIGAVPRVDGVATDAYITGDWDEVESAYYRGLLSDEEFAQLSERQQALVQRAVRSM